MSRTCPAALIALLFCIPFLVLPSTAVAQSPPTDLNELDLEEILALRIKRATSGGDSTKWSIAYRYVHAIFDGNRDGTDDVSVDEVRFDPSAGEERTSKNFPIVPVTINQQAHLFELSYNATTDYTFTILLPYIRQETDHVSIVPGFESFIIESSGIGDISLSVSRPVWRREGNQVLANAGMSLPVGSIDEVGPTPRVPGTDTQLPFTMQIGSGTFDLTPSLTYAAGHDHWNWGSQLRGTFRIGPNDRDYTLGNRLGFSAWVRRTSSSWVSPSLRFVLQSWGRIDGEDDELKVGEPGAPFRFPAAVTDPDKFGGEKLNIVVAATLRDPRGLEKRHSIELEWGLPAYQSLNGPQPKEKWRFAVGWNWSF